MTCAPDESIAGASRTMVAEGVGSIVVVGAEDRPEGIVTDRDLRERVVAGGRSFEAPVRTVMSAPLVTVSPEAGVVEALLAMTRHGIHHLPVLEGGRLVGVISSHDLLALQASGPLELARVIQSRGSIDELAALMPQINEAARRLAEQGLDAYQLGRLISEVNDAVIRRVIALSVRALRESDAGEPPVPYSFLVLGSEGRREQTLRTDQDNALVYDDPPPRVRTYAATYFGRLAERVIDGLLTLGYPRCPGGSMASNPEWRQTLEVWRGYFADWVRDPFSQNLLYASIYFDLRPVAGDARLAAALRDEIRAQVGAWRSFPRHLAKLAVSHAPPLGLFRRFRLQRRDGRRGLNIKLNGMLLVINALRAYAVDLGLDETNTIERLEAATRAAGCFTEREAADVRHAYETMFHVRLRHQLARLQAGEPPDNFVDPYALSRHDQRQLREAFRAISQLQGKVELRYFTEML